MDVFLFKETLLAALRESVIDLTFVKKDGTYRDMKATLMMDLIPEDKRPKGVKAEQPQSAIMRVFDTELGEFRSVNAETVTKFEPVE